MSHIYVSQINFEHAESGSFHDILLNHATATHSITEEILSVAHIYVSQINLEIPVSELLAEFVTNSCLATHTLDEEIIGTPVVEPEIAVGGGASQRPRVLGGRPWQEDKLTVGAVATHSIGEEIFTHEILETYAYNIHGIETKIRRPIYKKPRTVEILSFTPKDEKTHTISLEQPKTNSRQRDEEEMLLLGII